jgi:HEAT repeat protein
MARANLVKVIGLRGIGGTFAQIIPLVKDADSNVRRAAWTALGIITEREDLPKLLDQLHEVPAKEADFAEQAAVSAIQTQADRDAAVAPVIAAYRSGKSGEARLRTLASAHARPCRGWRVAQGDSRSHCRSGCRCAQGRAHRHRPMAGVRSPARSDRTSAA